MEYSALVILTTYMVLHCVVLVDANNSIQFGKGGMHK